MGEPREIPVLVGLRLYVAPPVVQFDEILLWR